jgi:hypothetical protein
VQGPIENITIELVVMQELTVEEARSSRALASGEQEKRFEIVEDQRGFRAGK